MKVRINGEEREIPEVWTVADLLIERSLQVGRVAVERNGEIVRRAEYAETLLAPDDAVEIVSFFGGG